MKFNVSTIVISIHIEKCISYIVEKKKEENIFITKKLQFLS